MKNKPFIFITLLAVALVAAFLFVKRKGKAVVNVLPLEGSTQPTVIKPVGEEKKPSKDDGKGAAVSVWLLDMPRVNVANPDYIYDLVTQEVY